MLMYIFKAVCHHSVPYLIELNCIYHVLTKLNKKVSGYDQEIPQSHTSDQPTAPSGRAIEH